MGSGRQSSPNFKNCEVAGKNKFNFRPEKQILGGFDLNKGVSTMF